VCTTPTLTTKTATWGDFPIMPGAKEVTDDIAATDYHYTIDTDIKTVEKFYRVEMKDTEWDLLGVGDMTSSDIPGFAMWYAKDREAISIDIWLEENTTHVAFLPTK
jgi:hypothetical protein